MKKILLSALLLSITVFAQAEQLNANELTLTRVKVEASDTQCSVDILSAPKGVIKHYISHDSITKGDRYGRYGCFIHLLHKKSQKMEGKSVTYTYIESRELISGWVSIPTEIRTTKIPSSK